MNAETIQTLREINLRFYREQAASFASTRRRIQPGVERLLAGLPDEGAWLDIGCGSGWLAVEWLRFGRTSVYLGLDFSPELLDQARRQLSETGFTAGAAVDFRLADLAQPGWAAGLMPNSFAGGLCFAVMHHLPDAALRLAFLREAAALIRPGGILAISVWQFQHSPKLLRRVVPWEQVGLDPASLEPGDTLLDWRHQIQNCPAYRYVHLFSAQELTGLARKTGFEVEQIFESDGEGGRLGLYQVWRKQ